MKESFENELRLALQRHEPPEGFAERVLDRISRPKRASHTFPGRWMVAAVAAALCILIAAGAYKAHRERVRGEAARDQLMLAMQITGAKVRVVQEKVRHSNE
ncbi:MAG: hypothetical protein IRZ15_02630 [Bryobacteraceae bacterium]|nr:hypothetical protein [Bryobacteraceae bacterium]